MKLTNLETQILVSAETKKSLITQEKNISLSISKITKCLKSGNKILLCGNGGSAADAQHLAAEMLIRLRPHINRKSYPALSLATDTSTITACGNDYSYNSIYSRVLSSLGNKNDILIAISTSGNSKNIIEVLKQAKKQKIFSICFLGNKGGKCKKNCDLPIIVSSNITARIQEAQIFLGHFILEEVEKKLLIK